MVRKPVFCLRRVELLRIGVIPTEGKWWLYDSLHAGGYGLINQGQHLTKRCSHWIKSCVMNAEEGVIHTKSGCYQQHTYFLQHF